MAYALRCESLMKCALRSQAYLIKFMNFSDLYQKRKYLCAIGSTVAGSQVNSSPSARTS